MTKLLIALAAGLALAGTAQANEKLAQSNGCVACHQMDKKVIGPSFKDIAAKYRAGKGAEAELAKKVKAGSKGIWGDIPMPANAHVKDEDIQSIVKWILTLK